MIHKRGRRNPKSQEFRTQLKDSRQFIREQAFFDKLKGEPVCLSMFEGVKRASSKNNSMYSLLDRFCFEAS
jgi:hypothetical protein